MRILGIDPGYERMGVAILEKNKLLCSDCLRTPAKTDFEKRLLRLGEELEKIIKKWKPQAVALEELYFTKNQKTGMAVAEVRGMIKYICARHKLPIRQFTPQQVKLAVTGYGGADKAQVGRMVGLMLKLDKRTRLDDELDAIAVALSYPQG